MPEMRIIERTSYKERISIKMDELKRIANKHSESETLSKEEEPLKNHLNTQLSDLFKNRDTLNESDDFKDEDDDDFDVYDENSSSKQKAESTMDKVSPESQNPEIPKALKRINESKDEFLKELSADVVKQQNEKIAELTRVVESFKNHLTSDTLILLNSLDVDGFKRELAHYVMEVSMADDDFRRNIESVVANKTLIHSKKRKESSLQKELKENWKLIAVAFVLGIFIMYNFFFKTIKHTEARVASVKKTTVIPAKAIPSSLPKKEMVDEVKKKTVPKNEDVELVKIQTIVEPKQKNRVPFVVKTSNRFTIRCENGYYKKFNKSKKLEGYIEGKRFYFTTYLNDKKILCSLNKNNIEITY